ncbi:hypothetical protein BDV95DRAFT_609694 [Massariosphaeria phaeospora]|uniref:Rhodopsin domain-containing protein n=1 Tax=Massariosphaeria phaeospora TaxID=100035 RepID=A0A7C8I212_9PLEO|nr:hypothetical protein BDV95DRAFT_609694 [Massariosphaeria phaeospora]
MIVTPEGPGLTFLIVISLLLVVATIAIILRIWARLEINAFGADDWLMITGWVFFTLCCIADYFSISYGVGAHVERLTEHQMQQAFKWFLIAGVAYVAATAPVKASICVLIMRISTNRIHHWILYGVIFASTAGSIIRICAFLGRCHPVEAAWDPSKGKCGSPEIMTHVAYFFGALCIATDWICAVIPVFVVWNIRLTWKAKVYVGIMLALGVLASIATIIRMRYLLAYQSPHDRVYGLTDIAIWSEVECCIGIVAGSLATMRPLLRYLRFLGIATQSSRSAESKLPHKLQTLRRPRRTNPSSALQNSYHVMVEAIGDRRGGADDIESDGGSQKHILPERRLEIVKGTQIQVTVDAKNEVDDMEVNPIR